MLPLKRKFNSLECDSVENVSKRSKFDPNTVPVEIWQNIIQGSLTIPPRDLLSKYSMVCKPWFTWCLQIKKELLNQGDHVCNVFTSLAQRKIQDSVFFPNDVMHVLYPSLSSIKVLNLTACPLNDTRLEFLSWLSRLEKLRMINCCLLVPAGVLTEAGSRHLAKLENLKSLDIVNWDAGLQFIASLTNLQALDITNSEIGEISGTLTKLTQLEKFHFGGVDDIENFEFLANFSKLRDLCCSTYFDDEGLKAISNSTTLEILSISESLISNEGLPFLCKITSLRSLDISQTDYEGADIRDNLQLIGTLTNLTTLNLSFVDLRGVDLSFLLNFKQLTRLAIDHTNIGPEALKYIAALTTLHDLEIGNLFIPLLGAIEEVALITRLTGLTNLNAACTEINAEGLKLLSNLTALTDLNIWCLDSADDTYMEALSHIPSLESIDISELDHNLSDAGVMHLMQLTRLRKLIWKYPTTEGKVFLTKLKRRARAAFDCSDIRRNGGDYLNEVPFEEWNRPVEPDEASIEED